MSDNTTIRRCPSCGTVGRMFRSHSRSGFERMMHRAAFAILMYRCHQCNWRGYMFRKFPTQRRWLFWTSIMLSCVATVSAVTLLYGYFKGS